MTGLSEEAVRLGREMLAAFEAEPCVYSSGVAEKIFALPEAYQNAIRFVSSAEFKAIIDAALTPAPSQGGREEVARAKQKIQAAHDAFINTVRGWTTRGDSEAERRFSDGECLDTAAERMHEALAELTLADIDALRAYIEALDAGRGIGAGVNGELLKALKAYQALADAEAWGDMAGDHPMREAARRHGREAIAKAEAVDAAREEGVRARIGDVSSLIGARISAADGPLIDCPVCGAVDKYREALDAGRTPGVDREKIDRIVEALRGGVVAEQDGDRIVYDIPGTDRLMRWLADAILSALSSPAGGGGFSAPAPDGASELGRPVTDQAEGAEPSKSFLVRQEYRWPEKGDRMRFLGRNGYDSELAEAKKVFAPDGVYEVKNCDVGDWSHTVEFVTLPGRWNGVMFELVEPAPPAEVER